MSQSFARPGLVVGLIAVALSGCSYPHAGPQLPEGASSAIESPANPPSVLAGQKQLPAASTSYPTGHPSLRPSTANTTQTTAQSSAPRSFSTPPTTAPPDSLEPAVPTATLPMATPHAQPSESAPKTDLGSNFENLEITDDSLKGKLAILRVGSEPSANDLLSVFAGLKNKTSRPLALEVQTLYKDKDGNSLNAGSWIPMNLKPHEETEYRSTSISADAADFLVRVRRASQNGTGGEN